MSKGKTIPTIHPIHRPKPTLAAFYTVLILAALALCLTSCAGAGRLAHRPTPTDSSKRGANIALFVRSGGLYAVDILYGEEICVDGDPIIAEDIAKTLISNGRHLCLAPDGKTAAYIKNYDPPTGGGKLYINKVDFTNGPHTPQLIAGNVAEYLFDGDELVYSLTGGGLGTYDLASNQRRTVLTGPDAYSCLLLAHPGALIASRAKEYGPSARPSPEQYRGDNGVVSIDVTTGRCTMLLPNDRPDYLTTGSTTDVPDGGSDPRHFVPAQISADGRYLYLFHELYGVSITLDGVDLTVYDLKMNQLASFGNAGASGWRVLPEADEIAVNPVQPEEGAIVSAGDHRELFINKRIELTNAATGGLRPLTDDSLVAMNPAFSHDGQKVVFAATRATPVREGSSDEDTKSYYLAAANFSKQHSIMAYNQATGQTVTLTDEYYNVWPQYLADDSGVLFVRCYHPAGNTLNSNGSFKKDPTAGRKDLCLYADGQVWLVAEDIRANSHWDLWLNQPHP